MNKTEAAEFLGISVRSLERYASAGRVPASYTRGKTGQVLDFDQGDLQRFKEELEAPQPKGTPDADKARQESPQGPTAQDAPSGDSTALARLDGPTPAQLARVSDLAEALKIIAASTGDSRRQVPTEAKLLLSITEAAEYAGVSRDAIKRAVTDGKLTAHRGLARGQRVRRADLEKWIAKL